jgi:hypothetical protein
LPRACSGRQPATVHSPSTAAIFWLKTRGGCRETPQDHRVGHYDVRQLSDEELERMIVEHQQALGYRALPAPDS